MRLVIDTNILISAFLGETSLPAQLLSRWRQGRFDLLTSTAQLDELMRVTRYPRLRERLPPALAGRLINELRRLAIVVDKLPSLAVSPDPGDDHLLALAVAGRADFLATGDKHDLLAIGRYEGTPIVTVRAFLTLTGRLP
jgi:putative PIN family toxin of toxin-antitoxin system